MHNNDAICFSSMDELENPSAKELAIYRKLNIEGAIAVPVKPRPTVFFGNSQSAKICTSKQYASDAGICVADSDQRADATKKYADVILAREHQLRHRYHHQSVW